LPHETLGLEHAEEEVHWPPLQMVDKEQATQEEPPNPQALALVPSSHALPEQHPPHDVASHTHSPPWQCWPVPQAPLVHRPPQPSLAPQAWPAQEGAQPLHSPRVPPPPHVDGAVQLVQTAPA
jgi:hypothetical protein